MATLKLPVATPKHVISSMTLFNQMNRKENESINSEKIQSKLPKPAPINQEPNLSRRFGPPQVREKIYPGALDDRDVQHPER